MKNLKKKSKNEIQKDLQKEQTNVLDATINLSEEQILDKLNSTSIKDKLSKLKVKEVSNNNKDYFFKYPTLDKELSKLEIKKEEKKFRSTSRRKRNQFANNILSFAKEKRIDELKKELNSFNKFYKEVYFLNDYSLLSISKKNSDNDTKELLTTFLEVVRMFK